MCMVNQLECPSVASRFAKWIVESALSCHFDSKTMERRSLYELHLLPVVSTRCFNGVTSQDQPWCPSGVSSFFASR